MSSPQEEEGIEVVEVVATVPGCVWVASRGWNSHTEE